MLGTTGPISKILFLLDSPLIVEGFRLYNRDSVSDNHANEVAGTASIKISLNISNVKQGIKNHVRWHFVSQN